MAAGEVLFWWWWENDGILMERCSPIFFKLKCYKSFWGGAFNYFFWISTSTFVQILASKIPIQKFMPGAKLGGVVWLVNHSVHMHTHTHCFVLWTVQGSGLGNLLYLNTSLCIWLAITFPHDWWLDVIIKKLFHQQTIIVFILCQFNPKEFLACHFLPGIWPEMLIFCFRKSLTMCWLVA